MLKIIAGLMAAAIGGTLLYAATRPGVFRISRSASIDAAPGRTSR